jgi:RimJ/RimL family protein N-acetyltransferase
MITTDRFLLRELKEEDVNENYLSWFNDPLTQRYIVSAPGLQTLADLKTYVRCKLYDSKVIFLGIFTKEDGHHIGNIKFEECNKMGACELGLLIGDPNYRGKGVGFEVVMEASEYIFEKGFRQIYLGVLRENHSAVALYRKAGFVEDRENLLNIDIQKGICMVKNIS